MVGRKVWVLVGREADTFRPRLAWAKIAMRDRLVELFALHHNLHIPSSVSSNPDESRDC
jgi:hypothetical protein